MPKHQFPLYFHEIYSSGLDPSARFPVDRYQLLADKLGAMDDAGLISWQTPRLASREEVLLVHQKEYVDRFLSHQLFEKEIRRIGLRPWKDSIVERTLRLTGGALQAMEKVLISSTPIAGNMAGGTHHAFRDEGSGYCIFNDLAICAEKALLENHINRILILDLDVHQGDGTAKIFQGDERVYTVSLHGKNNFPFRKQISDWDIEFENDAMDEEYLETLEQVLLKLSEKKFDLVFFQAGVDGLDSDALGLLKLSREGMKKRNEKVFQWRKMNGLPMSIFMGGGYAKPIEDTIDSFCDLFMEVPKWI